ncbi:DUF6702 family protein [Sediminicola luteus]|uniref:Peptidase E n=1 Tax=Sediminicola luteus TaxID=319238 RepID=A0A2A4G635_9FLAO|nr:DUF6702 family protein [Sediminicola luteus]PCE63448.1 hypothetical protein B7P33_14645 [Sediminicola luteus]
MRKLLSIGFLAVILMSFSQVHKFYLSVTSINVVEDSDAVQVTLRLFTDDLDAVLETRYGLHAYLNTKDESKVAEEYLEKYLRAKFAIEIDGQEKSFTYLGREYQDDQTVCYLEIEKAGVKTMKSFRVENAVLTDLFEDQQNIVHIRAKGKKKSFNLIKGNDKGMLNF